MWEFDSVLRIIIFISGIVAKQQKNYTTLALSEYVYVVLHVFVFDTDVGEHFNIQKLYWFESFS